jgi:hypothetical protein
MGTKNLKPTNGVSRGLKYTITAEDVSDGYVLFNMRGQYPLVAAIDLFDSDYKRKSLVGSEITYPANGQVKFKFGSAGEEAEVTEITAVADVSRSLNGKYFTLNSPSTGYYVWYKEAGIAEVTEITAVADVARSLSGKYFTIASPTIGYYVWYNTGVNANQVVEILCVADVAGSLNSKYFTIDTTTTSYYVWFDVNGNGVDPTVAGKTGIEINLATGATNAQVATAVKNALDALDYFSATINTATVTVTNAVMGYVTNAAGAGNSGFTVTTTTTGNLASTDPAVAGKTGIKVDIIPGETNVNVALKTQLILDAMTTIFDVTVLNEVFTITNHVVGTATNATAGDSGFSINITTQGANVGVDPAVANRTGIEVDISPNDSAIAVALATKLILDAMTTIFDVTVLNEVFTVTNHSDGTATDATAGNSGFAVSVGTQGSNSSAGIEGDIVTVVAFRDSNV